MILEPWKSADEVDRRLAALNDPELAELIRSANRELFNEPPDAPPAPFWKTRIGLLTLAGLCALAAGYSASSHAPRPVAGIAPRHVARLAPAPVKTKHHATQVQHLAVPVRHVIPALAPAVAPSEQVIRRLRAQLAQERAVAAQERASALQAQAAASAQAHAHAVAQAQAEAQAQAQALAQAKAEAVAQARAEEVARQQAEALTRAQAVPISTQDRPVSTDMSIKPGDNPPPSAPNISTYPRPGIPAPGPVLDPNCTPNRGTIFTHVLEHVRVGGTNAGALLRLIH